MKVFVFVQSVEEFGIYIVCLVLWGFHYLLGNFCGFSYFSFYF